MSLVAEETVENKPNTITFRTKDQETPILMFDENGDIYVKGKLVENDKEVVDAFREFLKSTGHLK